MAMVAIAQNHFQGLYLHLRTGRVDNCSVNSISLLSWVVHVFCSVLVLLFFFNGACADS